MKYRVKWSEKQGYSELVKPGDGDLKLTWFGMLSLASGQKYMVSAPDRETALVLLKGAAVVCGPGLAAEKIGPRADVVGTKPWTVMLPPGQTYEIEATADLELAVCQAPSKRKGEPCVIGPEAVKDVTIGRDNWQRRALIMVDEKVAADYLFIGEAFVPSGNWASFPPHRHDFDALPDEVDMEEIYYFRFDRPQGFGIQKVYTDNRSLDETFTVTQHDTALVPEGYHPVVVAPGYTMYYLWVMAGKNRRFLSRIDPDHRWLLQG